MPLNPHRTKLIPTRVFSVIALFSLITSLVSIPATNAAPENEAWHTIQRNDASLLAIGIDGNGNGWAADSGLSLANNTQMLQLLDNKLVDSNFVFSDTALLEIALSSDGDNGWAIGNGSEDKPRAALLQLSGGRWSDVSTIVSNTVQSFSDMALDPEARNGWGLGLADVEDTGSTRVLRLTGDQWAIANTTVPTGTRLLNIAADPTLKYVWASGYDENGDAALLYLRDNSWVPVEQPIGHFIIFDLSVDVDGNGWAGLDTNDEPANSPSPTGFVRFSADGAWKLVESDTLAMSQEIYFNRLETDAEGNGWALGNRLGVGSGSPALVILRLEGDTISGYQYPSGASLAGVAEQQPLFGQVDDLALGPDGTAWAVTFEGGLLRYGPLPEDGALAASAPRLEGDERCFRQNNYCLHGAFLDFWSRNGDLARFGLPITGELWERLEDGEVYRVQYTERARFEDHPENGQVKYQVLLGLLGNKLAADRKDEAPFQPAEKGSGIYFAQTGHNLSGPISDYWKQNGGVPVFGYPISEPFTETSLTDGKDYLVQYFERNRLEYHPEQKDEKFQVLSGLLGVQQYERVYGRKPTRNPDTNTRMN